MKQIVIIGTGGHGREAAWIISRCKEIQAVGFVTNDRTFHGKTLCNLPVLGSPEWLYGRSDVLAVCAIGNPKTREKVVTELSANGVRFITVIDPSAEVCEFAEIGEGCLIFPNTIISTQVNIGNHVHINAKSSVCHDSILENFVTLAPGVNVCGNVTIKHGADIGVGASIIQKTTIGSGSIIGAGAVVIKDIPENVVAVGVPAKTIKLR